jgi:hypothetical protein
VNANYKMNYKMRTAEQVKYLRPRPELKRRARMECPLSANSGHSNRSALAKRRTPGRGALIVKRLRGHSRSLPLPALAEQAGCGETANQPQKMYPYVMRLTLNHDGCD